jgi:hypothetical protein
MIVRKRIVCRADSAGNRYRCVEGSRYTGMAPSLPLDTSNASPLVLNTLRWLDGTLE